MTVFPSCKLRAACKKEILSYYMEGMSYSEIAKLIGKTEKSVDNAIQRIRLKMRK